MLSMNVFNEVNDEISRRIDCIKMDEAEGIMTADEARDMLLETMGMYECLSLITKLEVQELVEKRKGLTAR